eukprot:6123019-Prymnesium_polylepis.1
MKVAARRISQLALSRGWQAWWEQYELQARQRRMLRGAAGRMMRPKLSACFVEWRRDWEAAERAAAQRRRAEARGESERELLEVKQQLAEAKRQLEQALQQRDSGADEAKRLLAKQQEAAREERVAELMKMAARRISQLALSRGWQAWWEQYELQARQRRMLRGAASRLTKPKLAACFSEWHRDWEAAERAAARKKLLNSHRQQQEAAEREVAKLREELAAAIASVKDGTAN